jgi:hypothetical protein
MTIRFYFYSNYLSKESKKNRNGIHICEFSVLFSAQKRERIEHFIPEREVQTSGNYFNVDIQSTKSSFSICFFISSGKSIA